MFDSIKRFFCKPAARFNYFDDIRETLNESIDVLDGLRRLLDKVGDSRSDEVEKIIETLEDWRGNIR